MSVEAPMRRTMAFLALASLPVLSFAQEGLSTSHEVGAFFGRSVHVFGSHEIRDTAGGFYNYSRPEKRFTSHKTPGLMVYEAYGEFNADRGDLEIDAYQDWALGGLLYGRWFYGSFYVDFGAGLQVQSKLGHDLPSYVNSTPIFGFGIKQTCGSKEILYGFRLLHISNANTQHRNAGQNQILFYISQRSF